MAEITRALTAGEMEPFLRAARTATVAWVHDGAIQAAPAAFRYRDGVYELGLSPGTMADAMEVSAVVDAGPWYFDLRGVRIRGHARRQRPGDSDLEWYAVAPEIEVAWHYGRMRDR